jgi:hypothetical protein
VKNIESKFWNLNCRDATWEMEPNAFVELNQQYSKCDKQPCKCPNGREFSSEDEDEG